MHNADERKEVKIFLPAYLIDLFEQQAEYTGRSFNEELVNVLEKAIFLNPGDLDLVKATAEAKMNYDLLQEANSEEGMALLRKMAHYMIKKGRALMISTQNPTKR